MMNLDRDDASTMDEYFVTALHIFDYCGADSDGTLRVDALMDKFAPFVKTNKTEYSYLKSLLDPNQSNPEINVTMLARTLNQYSESQKTKVDFDESFNSKSGIMPQDSDSGISTDAGSQLVEDLQCSVREKARAVQQLRAQLEYSERQHEDALAALAAERDSLRAHLNLIRDENTSLCNLRHDYEEACERLTSSDHALNTARQDLDATRRRNRLLEDQVAALECDKATLQELLSKSKEECHRINSMYASRQSALREDNESLRAELADTGHRLRDHDRYMQQLIKEKVLLEMELKEMVSRNNQSMSRLERSIEVSFTEDQMLSALDPLTQDSKFGPENKILDEESFIAALKEDHGRATNMSLFDEIRLSMSNMSRNSIDFEHCENCEENLNNSGVTIGTQTDEGISDCPNCKEINVHNDENVKEMSLSDRETQTDIKCRDLVNNNCDDCTKCKECEKLQAYTAKLESDLKRATTVTTSLQFEMDKYEDNLMRLQKIVDEGNYKNNTNISIVNSLQTKIGILETLAADQRDKIDNMSCSLSLAESQTDREQATVGTQVDVPCVDCESRRAVVPQRGLRKYLWEPLKSLFQVFAIISFLCAVCVLYGVSRRWQARCARGAAPVPWRWLDAHEFLDLLLRIEYVADVPM